MATISNNDIKIRYDIDLTKLQQATEQFDKITAEERAMLRELGKLKKQLDEAAESAKKFGKNTDESFSNANNGIKTMTSSATKMVGLLGGIFAVSQIKQFASAVVETTIKFESMRKAIDFASGSMEAGAKNFQFVTELANRLGLDLKGTAEGYKTFASAANLAGQSNKETNRQFEAVAKAAQVMGLSAEDTKGAFLALGQMMSKGNVQAEELRGQLGERLVGAFGIAAKAMGVTTGELNKMLQKGQVLASDFLPKFATELENTFGKGNTQVTSLAASQNRFNSSIDQLILAIGNKLNPFLKGAYDLAAGIAKELAKPGQLTAAERQAKFNAEAVASKRIETELAKETFKLDQQNQIKITAANLEGIRKQIARNQLMGMEEKIIAQMEKRDNARIAAAGSLSTKLKDNLQKQENELAVLIAQENQYAAIAGAIINTPPPPPIVDEKERLKLLKKEYDDRLRLLELLKQQRILTGELFNDPLAKSGAEKAFFDAKLKLQEEYAKKGLKITKNELKVTVLESANAAEELNQKYKALYMDNYKEVKKTEEEIRKEREKTMKEGVKNAIDYNKKIEDNNSEMLRIINRDKKEAEDETERRLLKTFELTQIISDASFDIYQKRLNNEMKLLNNRFEEEIRLADGNKQKIDEIEKRRAEKQREIQLKQFKAEQAAAVARVIFETASMIAKWATNPITAPLAALSLAVQAAQIGAILAQPVPEFAEGTKGKPFKGGKAMVGERGVEKVVTESGKVYFTPPTATLVDLPKGSHVIPNHALSKQEIYWGSMQSGRQSSSGSPVVGEIRELGSILKGLPITQLNMDERGFEKFIRTPRRTTKILNNRFRSEN
jgi:tape measure domain-containing protein